MDYKTILTGIIVFGLTACGVTPTNNDSSSIVGMANPASIYCVNKGGTSRIITSKNGTEHGMCILPDQTRCEEFAFMQGTCPEACPHPINPDKCPRYAPPHPDYCKGGERIYVKDNCGCHLPPICDMTPGT